MQIIAFIWQSRIWIACCALACYRSQSIGYGIGWTEDMVYPWILGIATWCLYSWHHLDFTTKEIAKQNSQWWYRGYLTLLVGTSLAAFFSILYLEYLSHFLIPGIVAGIYIAFNLLQNRSLRDKIPATVLKNIQLLLIKRYKWIKPISIALVWAVITTPPQIAYNSFDILIFGSHTLLIFAIAVFFDLKNIESDRDFGIHTLAASWGPTFTKWVVTSILFLAYLLYSLVNPSVFWVVAFLLTMSIIWQYPVSNFRREFYFYFLVDGLILFPWVVQELI